MQDTLWRLIGRAPDPRHSPHQPCVFSALQASYLAEREFFRRHIQIARLLRIVMEDFFDALLAAIPGQRLIVFAAIGEEIVFLQDGRLMHLRRLGLPAEPVFQRVLQNPDEYLMPRYAPFEELPADWEAFSGTNYLGVQQHLQEEWDAPEQEDDMDSEEVEFPDNDDLGVQQHLPEESDAPEQEEDIDDEEEDLDDHEETMDCKKSSSQDVDAMPFASQPVAKRVDLTTNDLMLKDIGSSSSSVSSFGLLESAMPDGSPPAFGPIREPVTTSEVQKPNI